MEHYCAYCEEPFTAYRKDTQYCSHSCRQLAFLKRQTANEENEVSNQNVKLLEEASNENVNGVDETSVQNINPPNETSNQSVNRSVKKIPDFTDKNTSNELFTEEKTIYQNVKCKWIDKLYQLGDERNYEYYFRSLRGEDLKNVSWVSTHYSCLLRCILKMSSCKMLAWDDLAEITNALTFLISTNYFKNLPKEYPFMDDIISLRYKLNTYCLKTQEKDFILLRLKLETKYKLILSHYELNDCFKKISYEELMKNFTKTH